MMRLTAALQQVTLRHGDVLYSPAGPPEGLWVLEKARVEISEGSGRRRRVLQVAGSGDVVGDVYVLAGTTGGYTARVVREGSAGFIPGHAFEEVLEACPRLTHLWARNLARRVVYLRERMLEILAPSLERRLAHLLITEAREGVVHLPQKTMAEMVGSHRTSVNRVLRGFVERGWIEQGYAQTHILDPEALASLSRGLPPARS